MFDFSKNIFVEYFSVLHVNRIHSIYTLYSTKSYVMAMLILHPVAKPRNFSFPVIFQYLLGLCFLYLAYLWYITEHTFW